MLDCIDTMTTKPHTREEWAALLEQFPIEHLDLLLSVAMRKRHEVAPGGAPPTLRPCPKCGEMFSARELRVHKPRCGTHQVPCRFCGQKSNAMGTGQHEAICKSNPNRKPGKNG